MKWLRQSGSGGTALVLQLQLGKHSLRWKLNMCSIETEMKLVYTEKNARPRSLILSFLCRGGLHGLIIWRSNSTILIGQNETALIGVNENIAVQL